GATLEISYIDPRTEPHTTAQLMASGAHGIGILVRQSGRNIFIPEAALVSESGVYDAAEAEEAIAAAFSRLSRADGIQVGWLTGHGEADYRSTDPQSGHSGLRRALENDGCTLQNLTLNTNGEITEIPADIKVIAIVNPRYPITTAERALLSDWLDRGGRLICFLPAGDNAGLTALFEQWGLRIGEMPRLGTSLTAAGTTSSSLLDAMHPVTHDLAGKASVTFSAPKAIYPFDVRGIKGTPLVQLPVLAVPNDRTSGKEVATVVHAVERGSLVGADLGFRPGRMVLFGESAFAQNDRILNHASANRDLIVNAVRWLTGHAGSGARGPSHVMIIGQDLKSWRTVFLVLGGLIPLLFCLLIKILTWKTV
ncbi:MAG: Gldg family protein, partial [Kiritimatiellae bacterium]|nr:Gldg family protein [Kiritimatiellia bacterium]